MIELTQQQDLRQEVLAALEDLLRHWEIISDRKLTPQEIANVYSLFSAWGEGSCPANHKQYGLHIGPLLCHHAQQQIQFQQFWQKYWQELAQSAEDVNQSDSAQTAAVSSDIKNKSSIVALNRRRRIALRIFTLAILMVFAFISWNMRPVEKVEPVVVEVVNEVISKPAPGTQLKPEQIDQRNRPYLKQVSKRQPSPGPAFTHLHQQRLDTVEQFIMGGLGGAGFAVNQPALVGASSEF